MTNVAVRNNSITGFGTGGAIRNRIPSASAVVDASCNWYGTTTPAAALFDPFVTYAPWLLDGTDNVGCVNSSSDDVNVTVEDVRCGNNLTKLSIWHLTGDGTYVQICISLNAIETHLAHGDLFVLGKSNLVGEFIELPKEFQLNANYPNPFNPSKTIEFALPTPGFVTLSLFNVLGEQVATLVSEELTAGSYKYEWDATELTSGIYFYRLQAVPFGRQAGDPSTCSGQGFVESKKMILLK